MPRAITLVAAILFTTACDEAPARRTATDNPLAGIDLPARTTPIHFTDVTADSGLDLELTSGVFPWTQLVEVKGGGLGLIDYDGDGDLDLFVPNGATMDAPESGPGCRLFRNLGDLRFEDVTGEAGLTLRRWGMGMAVGDYDGDGHDDIYVTCYGPNVLLRNAGNGRFEDVTDRAGVGRGGWSSGAAFGDLDGDGDLDLYTANYATLDVADPPPRERFGGLLVPTGPRSLPPEPDRLFENLGNGTFRDVTESAGCAVVPPSYGLGVVMLDLDGDGLEDMLVGNDSMPNFLFLNRGNMHFQERAVATGLAFNSDGAPQATMGIAIADVDGNGRPDVFSSNFASDTNTLHLNRPGPSFVDLTHRLGVGIPSHRDLAWACGFYDFNHDGMEDLLVVNGHIYPGATVENVNSPFLQRPRLMARDGLRFAEVFPEEAGPWLAEAHTDRGAAFGDLDGDGDIDVIIAELGGPLRLLRNDCESGHWLIVESPGFGSRIDVDAPGGRQTRWLASGTGFLSVSAPSAHFGLPTADPVNVTITWPDGHVEQLRQAQVDQRLAGRRH